MAETGRSETQRRIWQLQAVTQFVLLSVVLAVALALVLTFQLLPGRYHFSEGDVVTFNIRSPERVTYTSLIETKALRDAAAAAVAEVTQFDFALGQQQSAKLEALLGRIADVRRSADVFEQKQRALQSIPELNLTTVSAREALVMLDSQWESTANEALRVLRQVLNDRFSERDLPEVLSRLPLMVDPSFPASRRDLIVELVTGYIQPTLTIDQEATEAARQAARDAVQPVRYTVEKNEIILRDGDVVTARDLERLEAVGLTNPKVNWSDVAGNAALVVVLVALLASYLYFFQPNVWPNSRRLLLVYVVIFAAVLAAKLVIPGRDLFAYAFPIAAVPMLIAILLDVQLGVAVIAVLAPIMGVVSGGSLEFATASLVSGFAGLLGVWRLERQFAYYAAGLAVGLSSFAVAASFHLMSQDINTQQLVMLGFACLVPNGGLSTIITLGASSLLGHVFGVTTTVGLLELAHPSQPLFRRLLTEAPGTYHHSVVVANLSERAAQLVGADSLLCRVAAYYHDIGKVVRPYGFVENQIDGQNIHDDLDPLISAKLVSSHVSDGLELARQHGLPSKVRDIIEQHHGTRVVKYFYHRACKGGCDESVSIDDFRYQGPRPQTKEAAIIMLADTVEAAVRAADDHSPENIRRLVDKLVNEALAEGQLDECDLSIRDLRTIRGAFFSVLQSIFHPRIKYPELPNPSALEEAKQVEAPAERAQPPALVDGGSLPGNPS